MIDDDFEPREPIDLNHAARTATRLVQMRGEPPRRDPFLKRLERRMWMLLDTNATARQAFGCPDGQPLAEHAADMTPDQVVEAAERLVNEARHA